MCVYTGVCVCVLCVYLAFRDSATHPPSLTDTPNLPAKIIPAAKTPWLIISSEFPLDMRIPPPILKILIESNPPKSRIIVRRLAARSSHE